MNWRNLKLNPPLSTCRILLSFKTSNGKYDKLELCHYNEQKNWICPLYLRAYGQSVDSFPDNCYYIVVDEIL